VWIFVQVGPALALLAIAQAVLAKQQLHVVQCVLPTCAVDPYLRVCPWIKFCFKMVPFGGKNLWEGKRGPAPNVFFHWHRLSSSLEVRFERFFYCWQISRSALLLLLGRLGSAWKDSRWQRVQRENAQTGNVVEKNSLRTFDNSVSVECRSAVRQGVAFIRVTSCKISNS
jgi:hypothetical protein